MESRHQNPEFRIIPENFHPFRLLTSIHTHPSPGFQLFLTMGKLTHTSIATFAFLSDVLALNEV